MPADFQAWIAPAGLIAVWIAAMALALRPPSRIAKYWVRVAPYAAAAFIAVVGGAGRAEPLQMFAAFLVMAAFTWGIMYAAHKEAKGGE